MRGGVCRLAALIVLAAAAAAAAPAGAMDCVPTTSSAVPHHAHVRHKGVRLHRRRAHRHGVLASAKPGHSPSVPVATVAVLQSRPLLVRASLSGNACSVRHHGASGSGAGGSFLGVRPGVMDLSKAGLLTLAAFAPSTPGDDLGGGESARSNFSGADDGSFSPAPSTIGEDLSTPGFPDSTPAPPPGGAPYFTSVPTNPSGPGVPSVPGVPEPGAWTLMIIGVGCVGLAARRRRRAGSPGAFAPDELAAGG